MFLTLDRLCERAEGLSNHVRRYISAVQGNREAVVTRLEEMGELGRISFGDPARNLRQEMELLARVAQGPDAVQAFLSFYYALQYIVMEIHSLDILKYHLIREQKPALAYARCIAYAQERFEELSSAYLGALCDALLPEAVHGRFVLLGVGSMGDRDDIDVAVVDDLDPEGRAALSKGISRLAQVMQRTACTLHFHMAEAMGSRLLSESIQGYERFVERTPYDPVVVSQLIQATPLVGDPDVSARFTRQVVSRFRFHPGQPDQHHEGFLRAMLGELTEMLQRGISALHICPKEDGLRPIKAYLVLSKAVHHVPRSDWRGILAFLRLRGSRHEAEHAAVEEALVFLETVRYLYQLLVVEEEQIDIADAQLTDRLETVVGRMGFQRRGSLSPAVPFLMAYHDHVEKLKRALSTLMEPLVDHLRQVTALSFLFDPVEREAVGGARARNLALTHVRTARRFFGTRYWGDLLGEFARPGSRVPERYVRDLTGLSPWRREIVLRALVEWGARDVASFLRFLTLIRQRVSSLDQAVFTEMLDRFFQRCLEDDSIAERLAELFSLWPAEIHRFLSLLDSGSLAQFQELTGRRVTRSGLAKDARTLDYLVGIHRNSSDRFLRHFQAAMERYPQFLLQLRNPAELRGMAEVLYGQAERFSDQFSRRDWLEAYCDLETARLGLEFASGRPYPELLREYRTEMHVVLRSLYFLCRKELYALYGMEWSKRHSLGIFLEAGCVGFQPFDPSLRLVVLLFQEDEELERFFREVVSMFQRELARLDISASPYPEPSGTPLVPRRLPEQVDLFLRPVEAGTRSLERLAPLRFNRIVGTRGHGRRFSQEVAAPLVEPVRDRLDELMRQRLEELSSALGPWPEDEPVDPYQMPGGVGDLERFYLLRCARRGGATLCDGAPACGFGDPEASDELKELNRNTALLQVLTMARRLLRSDLPEGEVDAAFVRSHAGILAWRPEIPDELIADPAGYLSRLAERNVSLMRVSLEQ